MFLDTSYGDLKYEDVGKWLDFSPNPDGTVPRIKLRRAHSRYAEFQAGVAAATGKHRGKKLQKKIDDKICADVYSKFLIITWEHFLCPSSLTEMFGVAEGERIPFSKSNAQKLLMARPRFLDEIHRIVQSEDFFDVDEDENDEGGSSDEDADEASVKN